jgi:geranylgeranyl reductase family protein
LNTVLLDKAVFPRDKTCGDGLTPRAVRALERLGVPTTGMHPVRGLRIRVSQPEYDGRSRPAAMMKYGVRGADFNDGYSGRTYLFPWPELKELPNRAYTLRRRELDALLLAHARAAGAEVLLHTAVTAPLLDSGRIVGVTTATGANIRAAAVIAADGAGSRLALAAGLPRRMERIRGVAHRTYFQSPLAADDYLELHLGLNDATGHQMPGYGWLFPLGDGTVNVGVGMLSTAPTFRSTDYRQLLTDWTAGLPPQWGLSAEHRISPISGALLPMTLDRPVTYRQGLLLVGDAAGLVNPGNGEGVDYALESGVMAADAVIAAARAGFGTLSAEQELFNYVLRLRAEFGGHQRLGIIFAHLIANPRIMQACLRLGLPNSTIMHLVNKLLGNLYDHSGGDWADKLLTWLERAVPSA